ncbi:hypothetical protein NL676_006076 [Syzygium grande]|nr:hypothetical protein NL676_006076 [Syzygium grande]
MCTINIPADATVFYIRVNDEVSEDVELGAISANGKAGEGPRLLVWAHGAISDETLYLERTVCNNSKYMREYVHDQYSGGCNYVFYIRVNDEVSEDVELGAISADGKAGEGGSRGCWERTRSDGEIHALKEEYSLI